MPGFPGLEQQGASVWQRVQQHYTTFWARGRAGEPWWYHSFSGWEPEHLHIWGRARVSTWLKLLPQPPEGDLIIFSFFLLQGLQQALWQHKYSAKSYIWVFLEYYEYFLHQQQGVVIGVVTDFLAILIAITNSWEAFKKRKEISPSYKYFYSRIHHCHIWSSIQSLFSSHTTISCWLHWDLHLHAGCTVRLLIMQTHLVFLSSAQIQMDMPSCK